MTDNFEHSTETFDVVTAEIWWLHELAKWNADPRIDIGLLFSWRLWLAFLGWFL